MGKDVLLPVMRMIKNFTMRSKYTHTKEFQMNKGTKNYTRPIAGALIIFTLLLAQGSGYLSQKLMVENNIRDRVKEALSKKQLKLAKFAYDRGFFDIPKRTRISDIASEIGLARATISEHLARIESILMDDMFSSYDEAYTDPKLVKSLVETITMEVEDDDMNQVDNMIQILSGIKDSIKSQLAEVKQEEFDEITDDELIQMAVKEHEENISFIDEIIEEKFKTSSS